MDDKKYLSVKEWDDEDKPREKLIAQGKKHLSNAELIAILLHTGVKGHSSVDLAKDILATTGGSLTSLSQADFAHFKSIHGMALAKSATLMAALELGWRMQSEIKNSKELIVNDSTSLFQTMCPLVADLDHEEFWAVYLSTRRKILGRQRISVGGQTETTVDLRIIFRGALEAKAVSFMVVHNHPSGSLNPSRNDRELTRQLAEAGKIMEIKLLDHIIIAIDTAGKAAYYSFHDNGAI